MQKIILQNLSGDKEIAKTQVIYTWQKDDIAYYFCTTFRDVFKVQFTGERWFIPYRWGNDSKIYQYKYLDSSSPSNLSHRGENGVSHGSEDEFYTTKEEAIERGIRYINNVFNAAIKEYSEDSKKIMNYALRLEEKPKADLTKLPY